MNKPKVYIDGQAGTTGLSIYERLSLRDDLELITINEDDRKNVDVRKALMNQADLVFLCLPDGAAIEAVSLIDNKHTKVIDASTAHRTKEDWAYGMCELGDVYFKKIQSSQFVANPGCHATGFIMAVYPLIQNGLLSVDDFITCFSLTGYSGGGKQMINQYENNPTTDLLSPRIYGLTQHHKHIPEMMKICGLNKQPAFSPIVASYLRGMASTITLTNVKKEVVYQTLNDWYNESPLVSVSIQDEGMIASNHHANLDVLELVVTGDDDVVCVTSLFDNLGKGACGAAIQNMNIMLGFDQTKGLNIK